MKFSQHEVSQIDLDNSKNNRGEQCGKGSPPKSDQRWLAGDTNSQHEALSGVTVSNNRPHLLSNSNESVLLQWQSQTQQPGVKLGALTQYSFCTVAAPVFVVQSTSISTPPSPSLASQAVNVPSAFYNYSSKPSLHMKNQKFFISRFLNVLNKLSSQTICPIWFFWRQFLRATSFHSSVFGASRVKVTLHRLSVALFQPSAPPSFATHAVSINFIITLSLPVFLITCGLLYCTVQILTTTIMSSLPAPVHLLTVS